MCIDFLTYEDVKRIYNSAENIVINGEKTSSEGNGELKFGALKVAEKPGRGTKEIKHKYSCHSVFIIVAAFCILR